MVFQKDKSVLKRLNEEEYMDIRPKLAKTGGASKLSRMVDEVADAPIGAKFYLDKKDLPVKQVNTLHARVQAHYKDKFKISIRKLSDGSGFVIIKKKK